MASYRPRQSSGAAPLSALDIPDTPLAPEGEDIESLLSRIEQEEGIPSGRLLALAKTESNLNPEARNKASSATGMFQFIDATGKDRGLIGDDYDYRTDPEKSARAAAKMLKENTKALGGDWDLGIQAHHTGLGGVRKYGGPDPNNPESVGYLDAYRRHYTPTPEAGDGAPVRKRTGKRAVPVADQPTAPATKPAFGSLPRTAAVAGNEEERGFWNNALRGAGERAGDLAGNLVAAGDRFARYLGKKLPDAIAPDETYDEPTFLADLANYFEDSDLGYEARVTWEDVKESTGVWNKVKNGAEFAFETGVVSAPDMVAMLANAPAYITSRTQEIAEERASNQGRTEPTEEDYAVGGLAAVAVTALDRVGLGAILPKGVTSKLSGRAATAAEKALPIMKPGKGLVGGATKGAVTEFSTEAIQEGMEYAAESLGTTAGANVAALVDRSLAGGVGGAGVGGVLGGGTGLIQGVAEASKDIQAKRVQAGQPQPAIQEPAAPQAEPVVPLQNYDELDAAIEGVKRAVAEGDSVTANRLIDQIDVTYGQDVALEVMKRNKPPEAAAEPAAAPVEEPTPATAGQPITPPPVVTPPEEPEAEPVEEVVPVTTEEASPDNTPLAKELAGGLNTFLNEDKRIRSTVSQEGRANTVKEALGITQSPLMERIDLVDTMLATLAAQMETLVAQGYNIKPLKDAFVRDTSKGVRRIGINKAKEGGILRALELKEQGKGTSAGATALESISEENIVEGAAVGKAGPKQTGRITNASLDKLVQRINDGMTAVMKAGPEIKTGTIPGAAGNVARIRPRKQKKAEPVVAEETVTEQPPTAPTDQEVAQIVSSALMMYQKEGGTSSAEAGARVQKALREADIDMPVERAVEITQRTAPTAEPDIKPDIETEAPVAQAPRQPVKVVTKGQKLKAKAKAKAEESVVTEPRTKKGTPKTITLPGKRVKKQLGDIEKPVVAPKKPERIPRAEWEEQRQARMEASTKTLTPEEIAKVEAGMAKAEKAKAVAKQRAAKKAQKEAAKAAELRKKAAEKARQKKLDSIEGRVAPIDETYEESPALYQGVEEAQDHMAMQSKPKKAKGTLKDIQIIHPAAATARQLGGTQGNVLVGSADAVVSPANSNGDMNGGIDLQYLKRWPTIEAKVKAEIERRYDGGQMPIGDAFVVKTGDPKIPNLIVSPTMSQAGLQPDAKVSGLAMMAALKAADDAGLANVKVPGMGTGVGGINPQKAGEEMMRAQDFFEAYQDGLLNWEQALQGYRTGTDIDVFLKLADSNIKPRAARGATVQMDNPAFVEEQQKAFAGKELSDRIDVSANLPLDEVVARMERNASILRRRAEDKYGVDYTVVYHGTGKREVKARGEIVSPPRTRMGISGVYTTPNLRAAADWAAGKYGEDNVGMIAWLMPTSAYQKLQRQGEIRTGVMELGANIESAQTGEGVRTFTEQVVSEAAFDYVEFIRTIASEQQAVENNPALGKQTKEVRQGRKRAATLLDMQFNDMNMTDGQSAVTALLQGLHKRDPLRPILEKIQAAGIGLAGIDVYTVNEEMMQYATQMWGAAGVYAPGLSLEPHNRGEVVRRIMLNDNYADTETSVRVMVHELVHAATTEALRVDSKVGQKLNSIYKKVKAQMDERQLGLYGMTNVDEFVAEAFTDANFQKVLAGIYIDGKTAWTRFVETVRDFLGLNMTGELDALSAVLALAPELMLTEAEIIASTKEGTFNRQQYISAAAEAEQVAEMYQEGDFIGEDGLMQFSLSPQEQLKQKLEATADADMVRAAMNSGGPVIGGAASGAATSMAGVPASVKRRWWQAAKEGTNTAALGWMTGDNLESAFEDDFEGTYRPEKDGTPVAGNPLRDYFRTMGREQTEGKKLEQQADKVDSQWRKWEASHSLTQVGQLNQAILESTMYEVDASVPWTDARNAITRSSKRNAKTAEAAHKRISKLLADSGGKRVYQQARDFYENTFKQMRQHIITNLLDMHGIANVPGLANKIIAAKTAADVDAISPPYVTKTVNGVKVAIPHPRWSELVGNVKKLNSIMNANGPYFPQMRFGDYAFEYSKSETLGGFANKKAAEDAARMVRADRPGSKTGNYQQVSRGNWSFDVTETGFQTAEGRVAAEKAAYDLAAQGFDVKDVHKKSEMKLSGNDSVGHLLAVANSKLKGPGAERSKKALREALITMLPESSMQKRMLRRQNIKGADLNARRVFANYAQSAGKHIAKLKYRKAVDSSFNAVMGAAKQSARQQRGSDISVRVGNVANEIQKRHNMNTESGKAAQLAAKAGFLGYLFSLSYSAVNATQPLLMTIPYLAGKHGDRNAIAALSTAYGQVWGDVSGSIKKNKGGLVKLVGKDIDLNNLSDGIVRTVQQSDPGAAAMLQELMDRGILDATFSLEISEAAKSKQNIVGKKLDALIELGRTLPYTVEIMNRATTALAAYNLEVANNPGQTAEYYANYAHKAVVKTQFDYTMANRPRLFKANDWAKVLTMFKIHPLGVYSLIISNVRKALGPTATKQERIEAGRTMRMFMITHAVFAGAAGSLLMEPIKAALALINLIFGDDDEDDFLDNPELAFRNMVYNMTGSTKAAEVATHGLPRMFGFDMSNRVGLENLMVMVQKGDNAWDTTMRSLEKSITGPIIGAGDSFSRAWAHKQAGGGWGKTLEYMAPKGLRDVSRGIRYGIEGMTDFKGAQLASPEDFSLVEIGMKMIGFGTSTEAEIYEARDVMQGLTTGVEDKRRALTNKWVNASETKRKEVWAEIRQFNDNLPEGMRKSRISMGTLIKSRAARRQAERETKGGVRVRSDQRRLRERTKAFNTPK